MSTYKIQDDEINYKEIRKEGKTVANIGRISGQA